MEEKNTKYLDESLGKIHIDEFDRFFDENKECMITNEFAFSNYVKDILGKNGITQQAVFLKADIPERYGYKLLSGEKRTRQRDIILRICYAAEMTLEETQWTLKRYGMAELYSKIPRDALLMIIFNERPGSIIDVNELLKKYGMEALRSSGLQD